MVEEPINHDWLEHEDQLNEFRRLLIQWGKKYFRPFPWRDTHDPYTILMAEIMLHRTQVRQVVPIFERFIGEYPDLAALTHADTDQVKEILKPLGLHWRINLIGELVNIIVTRYQGAIPEEKSDLLTLPGISEYIASAVRCFAFGYPEALIDTNTIRVSSRVFGLEYRDSSRRNPKYRVLIRALVDHDDPRAFNYALLDLAHLVCHKKVQPECSLCPVRMFCVFGNSL